MAEMNIVRSQSRVAVGVQLDWGDEKSEKAEGWVRKRGEKCRGKGHVGSMNET